MGIQGYHKAALTGAPSQHDAHRRACHRLSVVARDRLVRNVAPGASGDGVAEGLDRAEPGLVAAHQNVRAAVDQRHRADPQFAHKVRIGVPQRTHANLFERVHGRRVPGLRLR